VVPFEMPTRHLSRQKLLIAAACIAVVAILLLAVFTLFSKSVLFKTPFIADSHCDGSGFTFFSPFRSVEPETAAENFLILMKKGECERAAETLPVEIRERRCVKEKEYPLDSWRLKDRDDQGDKVTLSFCYKGQGAESQERLWLVLEKRGSWQVTNFWRVY
jgi:hypothetical protein